MPWPGAYSVALGTSLPPGSSQQRGPRGQADEEGAGKLPPFLSKCAISCAGRPTGCVLDTRVARLSLAIFHPLRAGPGIQQRDTLNLTC